MGKRKGKGKARDGTVMPFSLVQTITLSGGTFSFQLTCANLGARIVTESDAWALFRLRSFRFRLLPRTAMTSLFQVAAFIGSDQDTIPSTVTQLSEIACRSVISSTQSSPGQWGSVPRKLLSGMFPWYRTLAGAEPANESNPGALAMAGTGTDTVALEFEGTIEFKQGLDPANTPEAVALYAQIRQLRCQALHEKEKARLLVALSPLAERPKETSVRK